MLDRRRWLKASVKTGLGAGLALLTAAILRGPWPEAWQVAFILALIALAGLSALPRAIRMRRARCSAWA